IQKDDYRRNSKKSREGEVKSLKVEAIADGEVKSSKVKAKARDHGISKVKEHNVVSGDVREALPRMAPEPFRGKSHLVTDKIRDLGLLKVNEHTVVSGGVRGALPSMAPDPFRGKSRLVTDKHLVFCFPVEL
nr:protein kinase superfamily protein with octicosapeptide/Phox/Bem1p domain [Tanacetum cinerariifolium]